MEKVRPWCGQPSARGRLQNGTEQTCRFGVLSSAVVEGGAGGIAVRMRMLVVVVGNGPGGVAGWMRMLVAVVGHGPGGVAVVRRWLAGGADVRRAVRQRRSGGRVERRARLLVEARQLRVEDAERARGHHDRGRRQTARDQRRQHQQTVRPAAAAAAASARR